MSKLSCAFGRHAYDGQAAEMELMDKKPDYWLFRSTNTCIYCGKKTEEVIEIPIPPELREKLRRTNK